jgi:predicted transglutaminase-like cysteine proteinase
METFARSRTWRVAVFACLLVGAGMTTDVQASTLPSPRPAILVRKSAEPFGLFAYASSDDALRQKWLRLKQRFDDDMVQLALCDGDRDGCVSPPALRLLSIVDRARGRGGRARLGETNRAINLAIRATSDLAQHGQEDVWSAPIARFASGSGDCEDYAIAKLAALRLEGVSAENLRLVIMRDSLHGEDHAVAAARLDGHWLILDNRRMAIVEDDDVRNYQPRFVIDGSDMMRYAAKPLAATGARSGSSVSWIRSGPGGT